MFKFLIVCITFISLSASAADLTNKLGLGMIFGNPIGLSGKYWTNERNAVDAGIGMSWGKKSEVSLHSTYLFHSKGALFYNDIYPLDLYYGVGGRMEFSDALEIGVRAPIGLSHTLEESSADLFAEIAPVIDFISKVGLELHFGVGARYYF